MRAPAVLVMLGLLACGPGPTVYLGRRAQDAGMDPAEDDASAHDAGDGDGDGDGDDDDDEVQACVDAAQCDEEHPFCDERRMECVECREDDDCDRNERCDEGDCDDIDR